MKRYKSASIIKNLIKLCIIEYDVSYDESYQIRIRISILLLVNTQREDSNPCHSK